MASEINYKGLATLIGIGLMLILLLFLIVSAGCTTMAKNQYHELTATPEPTPTPTPVPTPLPPTPVPEPTLSPQQIMSMTGGSPMGELYSWKRENVSGYKDMSVHVSVYGYRIFGTVEWYSVAWGQYYRTGAGDGQKFLFVFVNSSSDNNMSRMWGIQQNQFAVSIEGKTYYPSEKLLPEIRLKEFDEIFDSRHVENIKPYGYLRRYGPKGEEIVDQIGFLKAGGSNQWDGYIPFEIPADTRPEQIRVLAQFASLAPAHWWQLS